MCDTLATDRASVPGFREIQALCAADRLDIDGAFHPAKTDGAPTGTGTLVLLGPREPGFWGYVTSEPEFEDAGPDPLDRWSRRVIGQIASNLNAKALFPFGDPPYQPFIAWALRSGRAWQSLVGLLVHDRAGLMVSYRGALALPDRIDLPALPRCPCDNCLETPCLSACPVSALQKDHYDLTACHGYLATMPGRDSSPSP